MGRAPRQTESTKLMSGLKRLVLVPLVVTGMLASCARQEGPMPNVLLLVVDTLRADHLGSYGSTLALTPHIDRFAAGATVFRNALVQGSNTINSAPSLLASVYLSEHGYTNYKLAISEAHLTLAEMFQAGGYETFAVSTNPHVTGRNGLAQGFDQFIDNTTWTDTNAHEVNQIFLRWLASRSDERPFFAMLWYIEPHVPYDPPAEQVSRHVPPELQPLVDTTTKRPGHQQLSTEQRAVTRALYRGEVNYFDDQFGDFIEQLEAREVLEDSLVILTADHGESFWEHLGPDGRPVVGHGSSLYREEIAVPLIFKWPRGEFRGEIAGRVDSIDILPTLAAYLGLDEILKIKEQARGASLLDLLKGGERPSAYSVSELATDPKGDLTMKLQSIESDEGKLVITHMYRGKSYQPPMMRLFEVAGAEVEIPAEDERAARLQAELLAKLRSWKAGLRPLPPVPREPGDRPDQLKARLEALGYLN